MTSSSSIQVHEGDVVEVDSILNQNKKRKSPSESHDSDEETQPAAAADSGQSGEVGDGDGEVTVKRGRVVVKEIGEQTKKGGYHLTLVRYKHFALLQRRLHCTLVQYTVKADKDCIHVTHFQL